MNVSKMKHNLENVHANIEIFIMTLSIVHELHGRVLLLYCIIR